MKTFNGFTKISETKAVQQIFFFRCGVTHLNISFKKGTTVGLQKETMEKEIDHNKMYEDFWEDKQNDWLKFVKNDALCTSFSYARYSKFMEELAGSGIKSCLTLTGLG